jgi:hypothetical protein
MDKDTRNAIERATQRARKLLEEEFAAQLEGTFDILPSGEISAVDGLHLSERQKTHRRKIRDAIEHKRASGMTKAGAVEAYTRDAAFTTLNRFVALKMLEARELLQECVSKGELSTGYREFCGMAAGIGLLPDGAGYRLYLESLFDELATEVKVLFDRRDSASILWPKRQTFEELLALLNAADLAKVWGEDETIGWIYQFFNSGEERRKMRDESQAPRNSRELAVRNQFFTPRYVVEFLTDNTLGRTWFQMREGKTVLAERCAYLVKDGEVGAAREQKDPRDIKVLDPACGSGHFLLYAFDLLVMIYEEAWEDGHTPYPAFSKSGNSIVEDYPTIEDLRKALPALILKHNLHGVDIDPRCAQIAQLALWMRAQKAFKDFGIARAARPIIRRANIVIAEPMPGQPDLHVDFAKTLQPALLGDLFYKLVERMHLAGEMGSLLKIDEALREDLERAREQFVGERETTGFLPGLAPERKQGELDLSGVTDTSFFEEAERRIVAAVNMFAQSAEGAERARRRMFADDAGQGVALLDLTRKRFDVVLMNPPFGTGSSVAKTAFEKAYPRTKNDLYAAFVERGIQLVHKRGMLGAITSRTGFFLSSFQKWREEILLKEATPVVFADLGYGVLDSAMVEVAAYCLEAAS